ncbi:MAG: hypothetical protein ACYDBP_04240 [Leptospirales bacterium]
MKRIGSKLGTGLLSLALLLFPALSFASGPLVNDAAQVTLLGPNDYQNGNVNCSWQTQWQNGSSVGSQRAWGQLCSQAHDFAQTTNYGTSDWTTNPAWWQNVSVQTMGNCGWNCTSHGHYGGNTYSHFHFTHGQHGYGHGHGHGHGR